MNINFKNVDACRLCRSSNLDSVLVLEPSPLGDQYLPKGGGAELTNLIPFGINRCNVCMNFQTVTATEREHYKHCLTRPASVNIILSKSYRDSVPKLIELVNLRESDFVLEIGSNDGLFGSFFVERGFQCVGVDPALNLVDSSHKLGVPTIADFFTESLAREVELKHGRAKIVIANFVVANVDDLDDFIAGVAKVLTADGIFVMETNYVSDIVSKLLIETLVHEHLSYFSVTSLSTFLEKHGLEIFEVQRVPSKGGSIRCFVQHKSGKYKIDHSVNRMMKLENSSGLFLSSAWGSLASTIAHAKRSAQMYCERRAADGIVGYGTSDGATTIIYQLGIGGYLNALIDDDPYRQNLESPGFGITTVARDTVFTDPPKARTCLILAPQYINQIFDKNLSAQQLGVEFAQVWPQSLTIQNSSASI